MFQDGIYQGTYLPHFICDKTMEMIGEKNRQIFHSRHCSEKIVENYLEHKNCFKRRYNLTDIDKELLLCGEIVRVEVRQGRIAKAVLRVPYGDTKNLIVVIGFNHPRYRYPCIYVITAWVNIKPEYSVFRKKGSSKDGKKRSKGV